MRMHPDTKQKTTNKQKNPAHTVNNNYKQNKTKEENILYPPTQCVFHDMLLSHW